MRRTALDLTNNALIVDYAPEDGTSRPALRSLLQSGYNSCVEWKLDFAAVPRMHRAIRRWRLPTLRPTIWASQPTADRILTKCSCRYALSGDANLDDKVNTLDFNLLAGAFNATDQQWRNGDFNYDGTIDSIDFTLLTGNYGQSMAAAALGGVVPD